MERRFEHAAIIAAVLSALWIAVLAGLWIRGRYSASRLRAVVRLATDLGIEVPPESADRLERRLSRRRMAAALIEGPIFVVWSAWYFYVGVSAPAPVPPRTTMPPMILAVPLWALSSLAFATAHVYDLMRSSREAGSRVARIVEPRLSDAVPPAAIWLVRASVLLPMAAAVIWAFAPASIQHGPMAVHPHPMWFVAAALLAPVVVAGTELVERRILNGRQIAESPQELAFDDALRVETVLFVLIIPVAACISMAALIAAPLTRNHGWWGAVAAEIALTFGMVPVCLIPGALRSKWARRHYLKHFAAYSAAPLHLAPPQVAPWKAPC